MSDNPIGASYIYLLEPEVRFLEAAVEQLIPTDDLGCGARDAGVVERVAAPLPEASFAPHRALIDHAFAADSVLGIIAALMAMRAALRDPALRFERALYWRMNHRSQRALREGDWKYLQVDGNEYLFNIARDERERANLAGREPERLARMREQWLAWDASVPPIPVDATVSLGYSVKDMPAR